MNEYLHDVIIYTPRAGFDGTDSLEYTVSKDGKEVRGLITFQVE